MQTGIAYGLRKNDDCENSTMLNFQIRPQNQQKAGRGSAPVRPGHETGMRLLVCVGCMLAGWHALRYFGTRLSVSAVERRALRDSTSDRRSAARWENEGGAMKTGHYEDSMHPK
jgi:hypothetical protein